MAPERQIGLSLIECIASMAIPCLLAGYGIPGVTHFLRNADSVAAANRIVRAVNLTRHAAITYGSTATLCPFMDGVDCGGTWAGALVTFVDSNMDGRLGGREHVVAVIRPLSSGGTVRWRSFRNRQYLQFTGDGFTNYQNGNFVYCDATRNRWYARQIVLNVQGWARVMSRRDDAGYRVDRKGKPLRC
ncbi:MAG: hypothetical protein CMD83_04625 [Gammaproteobacteria bacterium]|nr:hypothetical protein [Gammaproteobacteria bacterium]